MTLAYERISLNKTLKVQATKMDKFDFSKLFLSSLENTMKKVKIQTGGSYLQHLKLTKDSSSDQELLQIIRKTQVS